jgi:hypothetical protein
MNGPFRRRRGNSDKYFQRTLGIGRNASGDDDALRRRAQMRAESDAYDSEA